MKSEENGLGWYFKNNIEPLLVAVSSIVNEGIRTFLNLLIFFFLQEDFTAQKAQKAQKV